MPVIRQSHLVAGAVVLATQETEAGVQAQGLRVGPSHSIKKVRTELRRQVEHLPSLHKT